VLKVVPTGGCYLRVQRERMLGAVGGGGAADSSRTSWVPNSLDDTPCMFCREGPATLQVSLTTLNVRGAAPKSLNALDIALSGLLSRD
jgi:hypothetical protein